MLSRNIPGTLSGFRARAALIYLPPVLRANPQRRLPVLELLHGTPGSPADWLVRGRLQQTADEFAAHHDGAAPIIVMPDENGAEHADTECVASAVGDVARYLTTDVPNYVQAHFPAFRDRRRWAIAGLSEGGTCATMLTLRHQSRYSMFADLSGLTRPTVGSWDHRPETIARLFGGSRAAYNEHDPLWLLAHHDYPSLVGWFECGRQDAKALAAQHTVAHAARLAGISVQERTVVGWHSWQVWSSALAQVLPWMWRQAAR